MTVVLAHQSVACYMQNQAAATQALPCHVGDITLHFAACPGGHLRAIRRNPVCKKAKILEKKQNRACGTCHAVDAGATWEKFNTVWPSPRRARAHTYGLNDMSIGRPSLPAMVSHAFSNPMYLIQVTATLTAAALCTLTVQWPNLSAPRQSSASVVVFPFEHTCRFLVLSGLQYLLHSYCAVLRCVPRRPRALLCAAMLNRGGQKLSYSLGVYAKSCKATPNAV